MGRVGALGHRRGRAVERDRHDHDREAAEHRERGVRVEPVRHDVAEPAPADQPGDHDHREREQDRLVDGEQHHPPRQRQLHLEERLAPVAPIASTASTVSRHAADPERGDADRRRDRVDHRRDHRRGRPDREEDHDRHQVRERGHDLHRVEHRRDRALDAVASGRRARRSASRSAARAATATSISASVSMLGSHRPISANAANAASTPSAARQPPKRSTISAPGARPDPRQPQDQVAEPAHEPVDEHPEAVEDREHEARVLGVALVDQPALEVVEVLRERVPGQPGRPRELAAPEQERDEHERDDRGDLRRAGRATAAMRAGSARRGDAAPLATDISVLAPPAIASSTITRSTTPTTSAVLDRADRPLAGGDHGDRVMDGRAHVERRPVARLAGPRLAHDPAQRQHVRARDVADEVVDVLVRGRADELLRACRAGRSRRRA